MDLSFYRGRSGLSSSSSSDSEQGGEQDPVKKAEREARRLKRARILFIPSAAVFIALWQKVTLAVCFCIFIMQLFSLMLPYWTLYETNAASSAYAGLWTFCVEIDLSSFANHGKDDMDDDDANQHDDSFRDEDYGEEDGNKSSETNLELAYRSKRTLQFPLTAEILTPLMLAARILATLSLSLVTISLSINAVVVCFKGDRLSPYYRFIQRTTIATLSVAVFFAALALCLWHGRNCELCSWMLTLMSSITLDETSLQASFNQTLFDEKKRSQHDGTSNVRSRKSGTPALENTLLMPLVNYSSSLADMESEENPFGGAISHETVTDDPKMRHVYEAPPALEKTVYFILAGSAIGSPLSDAITFGPEGPGHQRSKLGCHTGGCAWIPIAEVCICLVYVILYFTIKRGRL